MLPRSASFAPAYNGSKLNGDVMSLVPCRACSHQVDTSAEACPGCGATNPGHKYSRQQRDRVVLLLQLIVGGLLFFGVATLAWNAVGPIIKQQMSKSAAG
jgi:hypothetical protein